MQETLHYARLIWERPYLRLVLAVGILVTSFVNGAVIETGIGLLTVMDQGALFLVLSFYFSIAVLVLNVLLQMALASWHNLAMMSLVYRTIARAYLRISAKRNSIEGQYSRRRFAVRLYRELSPERMKVTVFSILGALSLGLLAFILRNSLPTIFSVSGRQVVFILVGVILLPGLWIASYQLPKPFLRAADEAMRKLIIAFFLVFALSVANMSGTHWIKLLRVMGPKVDIHFSDETKPNVTATILMPASAGIIVDWPTLGSVYLPLNEIKMVVSPVRAAK